MADSEQPTTKRCTKCGSAGPFWKGRSWCKDCTNEANKKWCAKNKERVRATSAAWYEANKERVKAQRRAHYLKNKKNAWTRLRGFSRTAS